MDKQPTGLNAKDKMKWGEAVDYFNWLMTLSVCLKNNKDVKETVEKKPPVPPGFFATNTNYYVGRTVDPYYLETGEILMCNFCETPAWRLHPNGQCPRCFEKIFPSHFPIGDWHLTHFKLPTSARKTNIFLVARNSIGHPIPYIAFLDLQDFVEANLNLLPGFNENYENEYMGWYAGNGVAMAEIGSQSYIYNGVGPNGELYLSLSLLVDAIVATHFPGFNSVIITSIPSNFTVMSGVMRRFIEDVQIRSQGTVPLDQVFFLFMGLETKGSINGVEEYPVRVSLEEMLNAINTGIPLVPNEASVAGIIASMNTDYRARLASAAAGRQKRSKKNSVNISLNE